MANLVASKSSSCHGILHQVTQEHFKVLCGIESGYDVMAVPATPYQPYNSAATPTANGNSSSNHSVAVNGNCNGKLNSSSNGTAPGSPMSPVTAHAFIIHPEKLDELSKLHPEWKDNQIPTERYITIITQGTAAKVAEWSPIHVHDEPTSTHRACQSVEQVHCAAS